MSRYIARVPAQAWSDAVGVPLKKRDKRLIEAGENVEVVVAHGYDAPCHSYFCDRMEPNFGVGIYYGGVGLTKRLSKVEYANALTLLGFTQAADAVLLDIPY